MPDGRSSSTAPPRANTDLFHVIPAGIVDPFLYVEHDGRRVATVSVLDAAQGASRTASRSSTPALLGRDELLAERWPPHEIEGELALRACSELGVERARVPFDVPRRRSPTAARRRDRARRSTRSASSSAAARKSGAQLEGIRRAQAAADAAMAVAAEMIHAGGTTAEEVRARDAGRLRGARLRAARRRDRGARRPGRGRPRAPAAARSATASRWSSTSGRATRPRAAGRT